MNRFRRGIVLACVTMTALPGTSGGGTVFAGVSLSDVLNDLAHVSPDQWAAMPLETRSRNPRCPIEATVGIAEDRWFKAVCQFSGDWEWGGSPHALVSNRLATALGARCRVELRDPQVASCGPSLRALALLCRLSTDDLHAHVTARKSLPMLGKLVGEALQAGKLSHHEVEAIARVLRSFDLTEPPGMEVLRQQRRTLAAQVAEGDRGAIQVLISRAGVRGIEAGALVGSDSARRAIAKGLMSVASGLMGDLAFEEGVIDDDLERVVKQIVASEARIYDLEANEIARMARFGIQEPLGELESIIAGQTDLTALRNAAITYVAIGDRCAQWPVDVFEEMLGAIKSREVQDERVGVRLRQAFSEVAWLAEQLAFAASLSVCDWSAYYAPCAGESTEWPVGGFESGLLRMSRLLGGVWRSADGPAECDGAVAEDWVVLVGRLRQSGFAGSEWSAQMCLADCGESAALQLIQRGAINERSAAAISRVARLASSEWFDPSQALQSKMIDYAADVAPMEETRVMLAQGLLRWLERASGPGAEAVSVFLTDCGMKDISALIEQLRTESGQVRAGVEAAALLMLMSKLSVTAGGRDAWAAVHRLVQLRQDFSGRGDRPLDPSVRP